MKQQPKCACDNDGAQSPVAELAQLAVLARAQPGLMGDGEMHEPATPASQAPRPAGRKRLWEVAAVHHCVLLGAAFDARELRQMFRRTGYSGWETSSDYELHSSAVSLAARPNEFSRYAQRKLDERYDAAIAAFRGSSSALELLTKWESWVERGDLVPAYWAAITHPLCDAKAGDILSQEMHMAAHTAFMANRAACRRIRALNETVARHESQAARLQAQCRALRAEAARLRSEVMAARGEAIRERARAEDARAALDRWRCGEEAAQWRVQREALIAAHSEALACVAGERRRLARLQARIQWLEQRILRCAPAAPATQEPSGGNGSAPARDEATQLPDLAHTCVLCVGGRTSLVPKYRSLIEQARGDFLYHDGGMEDHLGRLPALLSAAHAVICFSGEVSHAAYRTVKRYCKVRGKPCALIQQPSMNATLRALATISSMLPNRTGCPLAG